MDVSNLLQQEGVDFIIINFENCEQISISSDHINRLYIDQIIQEDDMYFVNELQIVIDSNGDGYYSSLGYNPKMTKFNRILYRADIVSIDIHKNTNDSIELLIPYVEGWNGFNASQKTYIGKNNELHIEVKKDRQKENL